jgi:YD repeat-containing protein
MGRDRTPEVEKPKGDTTDATTRFADEVGEERMKLAAADRSTQEKELKPGVVKNKDGSEVEYAKTADGKVHPVRIKYTSGDSTQYEYDKDGNVTQLTNRRPDGTVRERWISGDGGKTFREERTGEVKEHTLKIDNDGTMHITDRAGNTYDTRTDGSMMMNFKDQDGRPHKVLANPDGSSIEYGKFSDGKERPIIVRLPDGSSVEYGYLRNGNVADATTRTATGAIVNRYESRDGQRWIETSIPPRGPEFNGKLEIKPDGTHYFTDARTGGTWVRKPNGQITITDGSGKVVSQTPPLTPPRR